MGFIIVVVIMMMMISSSKTYDTDALRETISKLGHCKKSASSFLKRSKPYLPH